MRLGLARSSAAPSFHQKNADPLEGYSSAPTIHTFTSPAGDFSENAIESSHSISKACGFGIVDFRHLDFNLSAACPAVLLQEDS